jgi:hypothetical protein
MGLPTAPQREMASSAAPRSALCPRRGATVAAVLLLAAFVAGCGGGPASAPVASLGSTTTSSTPPAPAGGSGAAAEYTNGLRYARCMRANGEPDFPDPQNPGGFPTGAIESLDPASHQFATANARCVRLLPNDGQPTPAELQQTIERGLRFARCMRSHGEPNFPDPGVSGDQITINFNNIDPSTPQFQKAEQTCGRLINQ